METILILGKAVRLSCQVVSWLLIGGLLVAATARADELRLRISDVKSPVSNRVFSTALDLTDIGYVLGVSREELVQRGLDVTLVTEQGELVACPSQLESWEGGANLYWRVGKTLEPGRGYEFRLSAGSGPASRPADGLSVAEDARQVMVTARHFRITHDKGAGGGISGITFRGSGKTVAVHMRDSVTTGYASPGVEVRQYTLKGGKTAAMKVQRGPVCTTVRCDVHLAGKGPDKLRAIYRYTYFADLPVVKLDVLFPAQRVSESFRLMNPFAFEFDGAPFSEILRGADAGQPKPDAEDDRPQTEDSAPVASGWEKIVVQRKQVSLRSSAYALIGGEQDAVGVVGKRLASFTASDKWQRLSATSRLPWRTDPWTGDAYDWSGYLYMGPRNDGVSQLQMARGYKVSYVSPALEAAIAAARQAVAASQQPPAIRAMAEMFLRSAEDHVASGSGFAFANSLVASATELLKAGATELPVIYRKANLLAIANDHIGLLFADKGGTLVLEGLHDVQGAHAFVRPARENGPLWALTLHDGMTMGQSILSTDSAAEVILNAARQGTQAVVDMRWRYASPKLDVKVTMTLGRDEALSNWTLDLNAGPGIGQIEFPIVSAIASEPGEKDFLAVPRKIGQLYAAPTANANLSEPLNMRFFGYYTQNGRGLYVSPQDPLGRPALGVCTAENDRLALSFKLPVENMGVAGHRYLVPGTIGIFQGDWYDGCQLYKAWALKQKWAPKEPLYKRTDIPQWLKETCITIRSEARTRDQIEGNLKRALQLREYLDMPVLNNWYTWFDTDGLCGRSPEWTNYAFPGIKEVFAQETAGGMHQVVYSMSRLWDTRLQSWKNEGSRHAQLDPKGEPYWGKYNGLPLAYVCPASAPYREILSTEIERFAKDFGVVGIYADLAGCHTADLCFNKQHGHPVGAAWELWDGQRAMLNEIRLKARRHNPDFILMAESPDELILNAVDTYLTYQGFDEGISRNIPMVQAVYGEFLRSYGGKRGGIRGEPWGALEAMQLFVWGSMQGRIFVPREEEGFNTAYKQRIGTQKHLAQYRRTALPWLGLGRMMRPLKLAYETSSGLAVPAEMDYAVETGSWQAPDKSVAFVFGNSRTLRAMTVSFELDPIQYGIPDDGSWALYDLDMGGGTRVCQEIQGKVRMKQTLNKAEARILIAKPRSLHGKAHAGAARP